MPVERSTPVRTATMQPDELALYLDVIPHAVRVSWQVSSVQTDALLGDLHEDVPVPLTAAQHARLTALMTIDHALTPRPLMHGRDLGDVLHHPRTAPSGTTSAIAAMCDDPQQLDRVAAYLHALPHGPLLLPGVLADLVAGGTFPPEAVADLFAEARTLRDDVLPDWRPPEDREHARSLMAHLEAAVRDAPGLVRHQVLRAMVAGADPGTGAWAAQELAVDVP